MNRLSSLVIDTAGQDVKIFVKTELGLIEQELPASEKFTLEDIYQLYKHEGRLIYVFVDRGLSGEIYRCGNYSTGVWQKYAETKGFA